MARMPAAEVDVTPALVRSLLHRQHPDLADREIVEFRNGWDNAMLRLGDDLLVRLPRRTAAAALVEHEQAWLPRLAPGLPAAVPVPVRVGRPGAGYPWSWSVLPWLAGSPLTELPMSDRGRAAAGLGTFLAALHRPADDDVWSSPYRGVPIRERADLVAERLPRLAGAAESALRHHWQRVLADPDPPALRLWVHGDVHPLNVLIEGGGLAAVIDWGDLTAGDPAGDLAIAWLGFDAGGAAALRHRYDGAATHGLDLDLLWRRAHGWAIHLSLVLLDASDDHLALAAVGRHGLARVVEGVPPSPAHVTHLG